VLDGLLIKHGSLKCITSHFLNTIIQEHGLKVGQNLFNTLTKPNDFLKKQGDCNHFQFHMNFNRREFPRTLCWIFHLQKISCNERSLFCTNELLWLFYISIGTFLWFNIFKSYYLITIMRLGNNNLHILSQEHCDSFKLILIYCDIIVQAYTRYQLNKTYYIL